MQNLISAVPENKIKLLGGIMASFIETLWDSYLGLLPDTEPARAEARSPHAMPRRPRRPGPPRKLPLRTPHPTKTRWRHTSCKLPAAADQRGHRRRADRDRLLVLPLLPLLLLALLLRPVRPSPPNLARLRRLPCASPLPHPPAPLT